MEWPTVEERKEGIIGKKGSGHLGTKKGSMRTVPMLQLF
jgi:hypothetical protein